MEQKEREIAAHQIDYKIYIYVWIVLMALLVLTIAVARIKVAGGLSVLLNLLIASLKGVLVLLFFMHLKYEGAFLKWMIFLAIGAFSGIIILTFADTWYRYR